MILDIDKDKAVLKTRMSPAMMTIAPRLEGRRKWLKGGGLSLEATQHNIEVLQAAIPDLEIVTSEVVDWLEELKPAPRPPYVQVKPSFLDKNGNPYQDTVQEKMRTVSHFALFMEQGTGKTKVAIDRAGILWSEGEIDALLLVGPKGVHRQWVDSQLPVHCALEFESGFWPLKELPSPTEDGLNVFAINVDAIKTKRGQEACVEFIKRHRGRVLMVIDESDTIKNERSQRWIAADKLGKMCCRRMILTGTPVAKELTDEWAQLKWLDSTILGMKYRSSFRNEYCIMGGFEGRAVVGHKNLERFRERVDPYTFRITKEDLGMLPKIYDHWRFDLTEKQRSMMKTMKQTLIAQIDSGELSSAQNAAVAVLRLQQIANGFIIDEDKVTHDIFDSLLKNPRIANLKDLLDTIDGKVVIWAHFNRDIEMIKELMGDDCVTYYGKTKDKDRATAKHRFVNEPSLKGFVGSPASAGRGIDGMQHVCGRAIYYSNSENSINRWQAEDRIDRIAMLDGQSWHTDMIAIGSTDPKILRNLRGKKTISDMALGDIRAWLSENDGNDDEELIRALNEGEMW